MALRTYAGVWWTPQDVSDCAKEDGVELAKNEPREFLVSIEKRIEDAMLAAGWAVIQDGLSELQRSKDHQPISG